jgi:hypothetical protein
MRLATLVLALVLVAAAGATAFLIFRVATFQRYNPYQRPGAYFGTPHTWNLAYLLNPDTYTEEGASLVRWLQIAYAVVFLGFIALGVIALSGLSA